MARKDRDLIIIGDADYLRYLQDHTRNGKNIALDEGKSAGIKLAETITVAQIREKMEAQLPTVERARAHAGFFNNDLNAPQLPSRIVPPAPVVDANVPELRKLAFDRELIILMKYLFCMDLSRKALAEIIRPELKHSVAIKLPFVYEVYDHLVILFDRILKTSDLIVSSRISASARDALPRRKAVQVNIMANDPDLVQLRVEQELHYLSRNFITASKNAIALIESQTPQSSGYQQALKSLRARLQPTNTKIEPVLAKADKDCETLHLLLQDLAFTLMENPQTSLLTLIERGQ